MYITIKNRKINIFLSKSIFKKFKGLMFEKETIDYGICLVNCSSIHTFFMRQNIDICATDKYNNILFLKEKLKRNKVLFIKGAYYIYELPLNIVKELKINTKLKIEE